MAFRQCMQCVLLSIRQFRLKNQFIIDHSECSPHSIKALAIHTRVHPIAEKSNIQISNTFLPHQPTSINEVLKDHIGAVCGLLMNAFEASEHRHDFFDDFDGVIGTVVPSYTDCWKWKLVVAVR